MLTVSAEERSEERAPVAVRMRVAYDLELTAGWEFRDRFETARPVERAAMLKRLIPLARPARPTLLEAEVDGTDYTAQLVIGARP